MIIRASVSVLLLLSVAGCSSSSDDDKDTMSDRQGTAAAESACVAAVNRNFGREVATVMSSEYSEAGSVVMLNDGSGSKWRCLASNSGEVSDLAIVNN